MKQWRDKGRTLLVAAVSLTVWALALGALASPWLRPSAESVPFETWYGNWLRVGAAVLLFTAFLLGFAQPRQRTEWRQAGLGTAFFIALFTEMFGVPLTVFLLAPLLGLQPTLFGHMESHLWAYLLSRLGWLSLAQGVYLVMAVSVTLIAAGVSLAALGWHRVYRGGGELVMDGIYQYLRHPQYLGFLLIILAFAIQWPTVLTLPMAPILAIMYVRLARKEDRFLEDHFGEAFRAYRDRVPAFFPRFSKTRGIA